MDSISLSNPADVGIVNTSNRKAGGTIQCSGEVGGGTEESHDSEDEDASSSSTLSDNGSATPNQLDSDEELAQHDANHDLVQFTADWRAELRLRGDKKEEKTEESSDKEAEARRLFCLGMSHEASGDAMTAVVFYRRAMQLVPDIEFRVCAQQELQSAAAPAAVHRADRSGAAALDSGAVRHLVEAEEELVCLMERFSLEGAGAGIVPANKHWACPAAVLPPEVYVRLFRYVVGTELDMRSLHRAARVCRRWYVFARDPELWHAVCAALWPAPAQSRPLSFASWRLMALHRAQAYFDGCYLSKASYVRRGEPSIDAWYPSLHQVNYVRALRCHADGRCYLLTSADSVATLVKQLAPARPVFRRNAGVLEGRYHVQDACLTAVLQRASTPHLRFHVCLQIERCSRSGLPHGALRWLRYEYRSWPEDAATVLPLEPSQFPLLRFSRVRSYLCASGAPLRTCRAGAVSSVE